MWAQIIIKKILIFFIQYKKRKISSLSTKERKAKFNTNNLTFRKKFSLRYGTLLSAEYNSAESLTNKYKLFGTKSKQTVNFSTILKKTFLKHPQRNI